MKRAFVIVHISYFVLALTASGALADEVELQAGSAALVRAFDSLYDIDQVRIARVTVENQTGEKLEYTIQLASKRIEGRLHSYGRFTRPNHLRNMAILTIETEGRTDDHFLYLPASRRVRRITSAQRAETFMGTDLTYEDLERRRADDYEVISVHRIRELGEEVLRIGATPQFQSSVSRVEYDIATTDSALLAVRSYKAGAVSPFRVLRAPRAEIKLVAGTPIPTRVAIENRDRNTSTLVEFEQLQVVENLSDSLFSSKNLAVQRQIPGLTE